MTKAARVLIVLVVLHTVACAASDPFSHIQQLIDQQDYANAQKELEYVLNTLDPKDNAELYLQGTTMLVGINLKKGNYGEGVLVGDALLRDYPEVVRVDKMLAAEFYMNLGYSYNLTQANTHKARAYLDQSVRLYQESGQPNPTLESTMLEYLAAIYYYAADYESAISTMTQSISLMDAKTQKTRLAVAHRSIGNSYWGLRNYEKASESYESSLQVLYSDQPVDSLVIGQVLHAKGYIHMDQEDYVLAYETFLEASQLLSRKHPKVSSPMVWVYGDVGRALIELGRNDSALVWLQKALNANVFEFSQSDYYQNPPLVNINDDFQHFMILKLKGQAFLNKFLSNQKDADLEGLMDSFTLADQQIDNIRQEIPKSEDQSTIGYYSTELYSNAIDALIMVYAIRPEPRFMALAHYFMEKRKITLVHLRFLKASAQSKELLPPALLDREKEMLERIVTLKSEVREMLQAQHDSSQILQRLLFQEQEDYEKFTAEIKRDYPSYHSSRFDLKVSSISEIQQILSEDSAERAIITYYDFGGKLRTSAITKDTVVIVSQAHVHELSALATAARTAFANPDIEPMSSDTLSALLFRNIAYLLDGVSAITFVLDPALQVVPMELLEFKDAYLYEQFDVSYHYSATLFASQRSKESVSSGFVGFAPSFDSLSLLSLPGAQKEVSNISSLLSGNTFVGSTASESSFKSASESKKLIHLASHATINEENPESSYLQFATTDSAHEDGKLHFFEIYNLDLSAELVTLSACNTGFGTIQKGEGVMSLSRAFAYAGVPAMVVSLWPVSDKSAPDIMKYFYQHLLEGQPKDQALNNAKKQYLTTAKGKARHPFYWGGFVLIGNSGPIKDPNLWHWWLVGALVFGGGLVAGVNRRKRS